MAARIPRAEVADIAPGDVVAAGRRDMGTQFVEGREGGLRERDRAVRVRTLPRGRQSRAVKEIHAGHILARDRVLHPFAEQVGDVVIRTIGLALINVGRGVVDVRGIGRADDVIGSAIFPIEARAEDVVGGAEHAVGTCCFRIGDGGPGDGEPGHAMGRIVERVGGVEVDVDSAADAVGRVASLADEVETVVEKLAK